MLLLTAGACAQGEGIGADSFANTFTSGGTGEIETSDGSTGVPSMGTMWCGEVPNPIGTWMSGTPSPTQINEPMGGGDPKGCICADQEVHAFLTSIVDMSGNAEVTTADVEDFCPAFAFRQAVYIAARDRCVEIAETIMNPTPDDYTECTTKIDDDETDMSTPLVTPLYQDGFVGDCTVMMDFGGVACSWAGPGDSWGDYYTLTNEISYNSGQDKYWVSNEFYLDLLEHPSWLLTDGTRIGLRSGEWQISGCSSGTICNALGLQNGDIPLSIDSMPLDDVDDFLAAYGALWTNTDWTLEIKRGVNTIEIDYGRPAVSP